MLHSNDLRLLVQNSCVRVRASCRRAHSTCGMFTVSTEHSCCDRGLDLRLCGCLLPAPVLFRAVDGNRDGNPERRPRTAGADGRVQPAARFTVRYTRRVATGEWEIYLVDEVRKWIDSLDPVAHARVVQALDLLAETGPGSVGRWPTRSTARRSPTSKSYAPAPYASCSPSIPGAPASCSSPATRQDAGTSGTPKPSRWPNSATRRT